MGIARFTLHHFNRINNKYNGVHFPYLTTCTTISDQSILQIRVIGCPDQSYKLIMLTQKKKKKKLIKAKKSIKQERRRKDQITGSPWWTPFLIHCSIIVVLSDDEIWLKPRVSQRQNEAEPPLGIIYSWRKNVPPLDGIPSAKIESNKTLIIFKKTRKWMINYMCTWFLSSSWGKLLVLDHSCNSINKTTLPSSFRTNYEDRRRLWNMVIAQIDIRKWSRSIADCFCQKILK